MERARLSQSRQGARQLWEILLAAGILSVFSQRAANSILGPGLIVLIESGPCKGGAVVLREIGFAGSVSFRFD